MSILISAAEAVLAGLKTIPLSHVQDKQAHDAHVEKLEAAIKILKS